MATIGTLFVNIKARTDKLQSGLTKARKKMKRFSRGVGRLLKKVFILGAAFAAVAGGLLFMIKRTAEGIDQTAKMARTLGTSTEALAGLQYAARSSGLEINSFNTSLLKITRRTAEAAKGNKTYAATFAMLGLEASKVDKMRAEDKLFVIADAMSQLQTPGQMMVAAFALGEEQLMQMVPLLREGSDGLRRFMQRMKDLGGTFSMKEALGVEAFNDAMMDLEIVLGSIWKTVTIKVAPILAAAFTSLANFLAESGAMEKIGETIAKGMELAILATAHLIDQIKLLYFDIKILVQELKDFWNGVGGAREKAEGYALWGLMFGHLGIASNFIANWLTGEEDAVKESNNTMEGLIKARDDLANKIALGKPGTAIKTLLDELEKLNDQIAKTAEELDKGAKKPKTWLTSLAKTLDMGTLGIPRTLAKHLSMKTPDWLKDLFPQRDMGADAALMEGYKEAFEELSTPLDAFNEKMMMQNRLFSAMLINGKQRTQLFNTALQSLADSLETSAEAAKQMKAAFASGRIRDWLQLSKVHDLLLAAEAKEAVVVLEEYVKTVQESMKTPLQKLNEEMTKLKDAMAAGIIDYQTMIRMSKHLAEQSDLFIKTDSGATQSVERATGGSISTAIGTFSVAVDWRKKIAQDTLKKASESVVEDKITNTLLRQIVSRGMAFS